MKKLLITLLTLLFATVAFADVLTTSTTSDFTANVVKEVRLAMPANCSAFNGEVVLSNCTLVSITEEYPTKDISTNGNKFIVYGLNADVMTGENLIINVLVANNQEATVGIIDPIGATPDAQEITVDVFNFTMRSIQDIDGDGDLDTDDVVALIALVYSGDATVVDLQAIINAVITEIP